MTHHHKIFEFDQNKALMNLKTNLKAKIFGQDEVIDSLVSSLKQSFAGFKNSIHHAECFCLLDQVELEKQNFAKL